MKKLYPADPIVLVDDELNFLNVVQDILTQHGLNHTVAFSDSRKVLPWLKQNSSSLVLLDINMPYVNGEELLDSILSQYPGLQVIMLSALKEMDMAISCIKKGAFHYLTKPVDPETFIHLVKKALSMQELLWENSRLKEKWFYKELKYPDIFSSIITQNPSMFKIFQYIETIGLSSQPVLITGETGVGKGLFAKAIHTASQRQGNFIAINVGGLDDAMFSDTIFGHQKGAYTGASHYRGGMIENARHGTLFLDEIGDLNLGAQVKLLRVLQEGEYYPLGSDLPYRSYSRIISATNVDLEKKQRKGQFRKDLFYRLNAFHIKIPPLRERKEDIPLLVDHFLGEAALDLQKNKPTPPKELFDLLSTYHFPGNINELRSMIYNAVCHHDSRVLSLESFKTHMFKTNPVFINENETDRYNCEIIFPEVLPTLREMRQLHIKEALKRSNRSQSIASRMLGISPPALSKYLKNN